MKNMNSVNLVGRLTRDMDTRTTASGFTIGKIGLAVNTTKKDGDKFLDYANFFDVTILGKTADSLKPFLVKGKQIGVQGRLEQERWEKDGSKFSKVVVIAEHIELLGGKSEERKSEPSNEYEDDIPF